MKYTDLIPNQIYRGKVNTSSTTWIFKYTPWRDRSERDYKEGHHGLCYSICNGHITKTKKDRLYCFNLQIKNKIYEQFKC